MYVYYLITLNNVTWTLRLSDDDTCPPIQSELETEIGLELVLVVWHGPPSLPIIKVEYKSK